MKFNFAPYSDTFNPDENFYKFLYKPGYEVQARELNAMQSMLQNQISSIGNHLFKNGAKISGCSSAFVQYDYVRLNETFNNIKIELSKFNNKSLKVIGTTSKVEATIIDVSEQSDTEAPVLYIIYTKTGIDNIQSTFIQGEDLEFIDINNVNVYNATVRCPSCPENVTSDIVAPLGKSMFFNIDEGIFYYNGYFVKVQRHHIIIEQYLTKDADARIISNKIYQVILAVKEEIITADDDESLYDPHLGYPNEALEGADRYKVTMTLATRDYIDDADDTSYITIARVRQNHNVEYKKDDTDYGEIMKELARRTYESSGNFANVPWKAYFLNEKKKQQSDTKGWSVGGKDEKFVAVIAPGTGYVKGYRVSNLADIIATGRKTRDTKTLRGGAVSIPECTSIDITIDTNISWLNHNGNSTLSDQVFNIKNAANVSIGSFKAYDLYKTGDKTYRIYLYNLVMVTGNLIASGTTINLEDGSFTAKVNGIMNLENANQTTLLFPLGYTSVKTIRDNDNNNNGNTDVEVRKRLTGVLSANGSITFTTGTNESFVSPISAHPICWVGNNPTGVSINITQSMYSFSSNTLTLNLGSGNGGKNVTFITTMIRTSQTEKTKTLTRHSYTTSARPPSDVNTIVTLPHADGYRVDSVTLVSISDPDIKEDLLAEYTFNNGQTDNFYEPANLARVSSHVFNNDDRLIITYWYFEHSGNAPFFSVDSYKQLIDDQDLDLEYSDIPTYTDRNSKVYRLAEYLDYRTIKTNTVNNNALLPTFNSTAIFDVEYYLARNDLLLVDQDSNFYFKEGIPSENPVLPQSDENSMPLYEVYIKPYVYSIDDINVRYVDNKSFSMKDIARLFKRVENLEYAVSLSMLEQQTLNMSTKDVNGLDRYKNGFLVDNFKGYYANDVNNPEFMAALDRSNGYLRPQFKTCNTKLSIDITKSSNLTRFGNMAITKFEHDLFIQNPYATSTLSINPYMVFRRNGTMALSPNIDTWSDDTQLPNLVTDIDAGVDAFKQIADNAKLTGTDYGSWIDYNTSIIDSSSITNTSASDAWRTSVQTINTTTTQTDSQRTVTKTTVGSETQSYSIDDIVKDVSIIPYIRSRIVQFYATNLKPNTQLYAYFDGTNVTTHCRPTTQISGTSTDSIFGNIPLISNSDGTLVGEFRIPSNTFFTGEKKFVLTNDPNNTGNPDIETTRCESTYFAGGVSQTKQSSTLNVITPTFNRETTVENKSSTTVNRDVNVKSFLNNTPSVIINEFNGPNIPDMPAWEGIRYDSHFHWLFDGTRWVWDPIAQGFKVDDSCFISKVGVYFANVDLDADIVWFEIREMVNGYPSNTAIARREVKATVLKPFASTDGKKEYQVIFPVPVYVDKSKSYAFVIGGFSPETRVYISTLGSALIDNPNSVLEQPPLGYTMFRSLNGDTWNAQQFDTMKINIYRCVFDMTGTTVTFNADRDDFYTVADVSPIEFVSGSKFVTIHAKNHGLRNGDNCILDFSQNKRYDITITSGTPQVGQRISSVTASAIIRDISVDTNGLYSVLLEKQTGEFVPDQVFTCEASQYEYRDTHLINELGINVSPITVNSADGKITNISNYATNSMIGDINTSVLARSHIVKDTKSIDSFVIELAIPPTKTGRFGTETIIVHNTNIKYDMFNIAGSSLTYDSKAVWSIRGTSIDGNVLSPVNITPLADTYNDIPHVLLSKLNEKGSNSFELSIVSKLASPYISPVFNTDSFSITTVSNRIEYLNEMGPGYIDETHNNGDEKYKYISSLVVLENPAVDLRVIFDVYNANTSSFDVYVKIMNSTTDDESLISWTKIDKYDRVRVNNTDFVEYDLTLSTNCSVWNDTTQYIAFRVKLVGKGSNSSKAVIFQNLRAIALT